MKKLNTNARVTEAGDVGNQLVSFYKKSPEVKDESHLAKIFSEIEKRTNALTEAVNKGTINSKLEDADAKRDKEIRVLGKLLDAYKVFPNEEIRANGEKLALIFDRYGLKIINESYINESNLIDALLLDLKSEDLKTAITSLAGVQDAITAITTAQEDFKKNQADYQSAKTQNNSTDSASTLRKPLLDLINKELVPYLTALQMANKEKYTPFVLGIEAILDDANKSIKGRTTKTNPKA